MSSIIHTSQQLIELSKTLPNSGYAAYHAALVKVMRETNLKASPHLTKKLSESELEERATMHIRDNGLPRCNYVMPITDSHGSQMLEYFPGVLVAGLSSDDPSFKVTVAIKYDEEGEIFILLPEFEAVRLKIVDADSPGDLIMDVKNADVVNELMLQYNKPH